MFGEDVELDTKSREPSDIKWENFRKKRSCRLRSKRFCIQMTFKILQYLFLFDMMFRFYNNIQSVYDILPQHSYCDRDIRLYNVHDSADLFTERAQDDYKEFKGRLEDLNKKMAESSSYDFLHVRAAFKDVADVEAKVGNELWQTFMKKGNPYTKKDAMAQLEGSLYCYCYARKNSPLRKDPEFKKFMDQIDQDSGEFNDWGCENIHLFER